MNNFYNRGQSLIGIIIVLIVASLIGGGLYYHLQKQIPGEVPTTPEKPAEVMVKPEEKAIFTSEPEKPIVQKCTDGSLYGQCSGNKPKYCDNGNLINKYSVCGCPSGQQCIINGNCITPIVISNYYNICWDYDCSVKFPPYPKLLESKKPNAIKIVRDLRATGVVDIFVIFLYSYDPLPEEQINILKGPENDGNSLRYITKWYKV